MNRLLFILLFAFSCARGWGQLSVQLTVQEALYPGSMPGVARANEPFCQGVPIADSAAIATTNGLTLAGAAAGQFRILGTWPDGNAKWIKVCGIVPSLAAGGTATVTLTGGGSGNFGGSNLATDNGSTITVNTGAATFSIKKANFNVIDSVVMGSTTVVASSTAQTRGLVLTGPNPAAGLPGNVTCAPDPNGSACTTIYSSANDPASTCAIEEGGPVMTVIRCIGTHKDSRGDPYMQFTAREYFYQGKANVKVTAVLRNANWNTSASPSPDCNYNSNSTQCGGGSFDSAAKGIRAYELRIGPNISGTLNYTLATNTSPQTGTLTPTDLAYIYQGASNWLVPTAAPDTQYCGPGTSYCSGMYTADTGFVAMKDTTTLASGDLTAVIGGWADIADVNGVGVEIGIDQMAAMWPASLEFQSGGTDVRLGLFSQYNSKNVYMPWPMWKVFETYLTFHASALASQANEFLKQQHFLVARPSITYTNSTSVFPYPILDPAIEDSYYVSTQQQATPALPLANFCYGGATTNCTPDRGTINTQNQLSAGIDLGIYRYYAWSQGGSLNQEEFRWGDLLKFLQRGYTGRYLNSRYFYRFLSELHWPHADGTTSSDPTVNGFTWRSRTYPELEFVAGTPLPLISNGAQINESLAFGISVSGAPMWRDYLHDHWYGMTDYYFLTGDEFVKEAMVPNKDWYLNANTSSYGISSTNNAGVTRAFGVWLLGTSRYGQYLQALGDPDTSAVLASGQHQFDSYINVQACESGVRPGSTTPTYYPVGCAPGPVATGYVGGSGSGAPGVWTPGISFERGNHQSNSANNYCAWNTGSDSGMYGYYRIEQTFQQSILVEGLLSLRKAIGPTWNNYNRAFDLAYGLSQNNVLEMFNDDGQTHWSDGSGFYNGFAYYRPIDFPVVCPSNTTNADGQLAGPLNGKFYDKTGLPNGDQGIYFTFYALNQMTGALTPGSNLARQFNIALQMGSTAVSAWLGDWGMYSISNLIWALNNPATSTLQDVPFTVVSLGSGNYQLTFTTPAGTCTNDPGCVRVKWSPKIIRPWTQLLGFDSLNTNTFTYDPNVYATWFASNNVWPEPTATPGVSQTFTVSTGTTGLTAANFSLKAISPGTATTPTIGPAANLSSVSGNGQTGPLGQPLPTPFSVLVTDANGNPVSGVSVAFAVNGGGGTVNPTTTTTSSLGLASSTLTLGTTAGTNTVKVSSGSLAGSPVTFTATGTASGPVPAAKLVLVSGNSQTGTVGQGLANPFVVEVTDANGNAVSGTTVTFAVTAGGGALSATSVATTSQGLASASLTLGASAGTNTVTASSGSLTGSPLTFTATANVASAGPAAKLVLVSGNGQSGAVGLQLASPLVVEVTDANGNAVSGTTVTFAVTAGGGALSATSVPTSSQGLASVTLTLGASAGTNTVTASSGSLSGSPLTFTATGNTVQTGGGTVTWVKQSPPTGLPGFLGYLTLPYDPVSNQTMLWSNDGGIYSSHMRFYNSTTNAFTAMPGSGSTGDACPPDLPNMASDRHPDGQMAIDTKRNFLWVFAGVNQNCGLGYANISGTTVTLLNTQYTAWTFPTGGQIVGQTMSITGAGNYTIASVQSSNQLTLTSSPGTLSNVLFYIITGTESNPRQDMYYLTLGATASNDVWTQVSPKHLPTPAQGYASAMVYDPNDDVLFAFGNIGNWIYCRTLENPVPGTATTLQHAAGCAVPDDWNQITPNTPGGAPPGSYFPQMVYDTLSKNVIQYGGVCNSNTGVGCNQTWAYNIPTHTWTQKALNTTPPPVYQSSQAMSGTDEGSTTYNSVTHKVIYHQTTNTGAPADWQYDPVADTWSLLTSINGGPTMTQAYLGYDVSTNSLIAWAYDPSGTADVWKGSLGAPVVAGPAATLFLVSGNGQSGSLSLALPNPFVVEVTDANGIPVSGATVTFAVTAGGGSLGTSTVTTNTQGMASATLTLGPNAGTNTVSASSGSLAGSPITFTATGTAAPPTVVGPAATLALVSGNSQSGAVGTALSSPFVVEVTDTHGNPVSGTSVTFAVTAGGGTLSSGTVSTNSQGQATSTLTLGAVAGTNTVTATSVTLSGSPATFTATGTGVSCSTYDLNADGLVNVLDAQIAISQALGTSPCTNGDVNHDGKCNVIDVQLVATAAVSSCVSWSAVPAPPGSSNPSIFVKTDTTTQGSWMGVYGADGYTVAGDTTVLPSYVTVTWSGNQFYEWSSSTPDVRALQQPSLPTNRLAAAWYNGNVMTANLAFNDGNTHQVEAYVVDWDNSGRSEQITILDSSNNVLDNRTITGFYEGQYLVWNLSGNVTIQVTNSSGSRNAVVSALFFR